MDQLIDVRRYIMEYITRFKERRINALFAEAIKDLEDANEARRKKAMDEENKRRVLEGIFVDLVREIRQRRCPQMAQKIMIMLIAKHNKRQEMQEEFLAKFKVRDNKMLMDTIKKLEVVNEVRRKEAWDQENRRRVLDNIFIDLVRKMRERRCPQMAKKIMIKLLELHDKRRGIHEQLIAKTKEREQRMLAKKQIHRELLGRVQRRENDIKHRANVLKEMMDKIKELKLEKIKNFGYVDRMHSQIEKPEEDEDFLPRKLFFIGVDTLNVQPKIMLEAAMKQSSSNKRAEERKELKFENDTGHECPLPKKPKMRTTFLGRMRRLFGLK
uniref:Uncharacterized protein LOC111138149 n=1 Tax=Crassostrea virginica TaxID=6565 RepID=A0A8B8F0I3_CRAVI|nr:uncharacterized protein LOC111138149 [Crassostrea virginica]XP_022345698.1 uncharacterized protein LOC111138149 [Crassostrea virginica]